MIKVEFSFHWGYGNTQKEIMEYEDDVTDEKIEEDYKFWLWDEVIGDRVGWQKIEE